jgi:hypothetical protein
VSSTRKSEPIHEFFVIDPSGESDFETNRRAEIDADKWLSENKAILHSLIRDRNEILLNGILRVHYKVYGKFLQ